MHRKWFCNQLCYYDSNNNPQGCPEGCQCVAHRLGNWYRQHVWEMSTPKCLLILFVATISLLNDRFTCTEMVCNQLCYYDSNNNPQGCPEGCQCVAHDWGTGTVNMSGRCMNRMSKR
uniref:Putative secreted peptide n=1 Tax=Rhipicephalus microplus TaxID=6941 RepID=A0A6G5AGV5_RHIMP